MAAYPIHQNNLKIPKFKGKRVTRYCLILLVFIIILAGCGGLAGDPVIVATLPPEVVLPSEAPNLANGAQLFAQHCSACHGTNGNGRGDLVETGQIPAMPSFLDSAHVGTQTPQQYYSIITSGNLQNLMPPWNETLAEQERWDVALYVYTLAYTPEQIRTGEQIATAIPVQDVPDTNSLYIQSDAALFETFRNRPGNTISDSDLRGFVAYLRASNFAGGALAPEVTREPLPATITIRGTVTQQTAGASIPADTTVALRYGNAEVGIQTQATRLLPDNTYIFEDVPVNADFAYVTVIFYQDRVFASDVRTPNELDVVTELPIALYAITEDPFVVTISQVDTVLQPHEVAEVGTGLVFTQRITFKNAADRAYSLSRPIGEGTYPSVVWQLPPGAIILNLDNPARYIVSDEQDIIVDTQMLLPGEHTMQIIYFVPYTEGAIIDQPLTNALDGTLNFTVIPNTLTIFDDRLQLVTTDTNTNAEKSYTGSVNIPFGSSWKYEIRGSLSAAPATPPGIVTADNLLPMLLIAIIIGVLLAVGYVLLRRRAPNPNIEINALVRQIAELDTLHTSGHINHDAYQQQRQELKIRLAALMSGNATTDSPNSPTT